MRRREAYAYTDGASTGSRGPGGYGAVMTWKGKTEEISGGEQHTTNLRMELTAACVALEAIDKGHVVTVYSDSSYLVNCMRRGWHKKWREKGWLNYRKEPVANRDLWERLLDECCVVGAHQLLQKESGSDPCWPGSHSWPVAGSTTPILLVSSRTPRRFGPPAL